MSRTPRFSQQIVILSQCQRACVSDHLTAGAYCQRGFMQLERFAEATGVGITILRGIFSRRAHGMGMDVKGQAVLRMLTASDR